MKTNFIKINDISEINTSKISVRDIGNRYIDKDGRMYGLKYDRKARKVNIIRIIRTPAKSADYFHQMLRAQKKEELANLRNNAAASESQSASGSAKEEKKVKEVFDANKFINETIDLMQTHKGRIAGIMMNIKNSRMISERDKQNFTLLNDLFRNLEIDGISRIDKVLSNYKEIKNYPRSLTYYISKLDSKNRRVIDDLDTDTRKMVFIIAAEMFYSIKALYRTLHKICIDLNNFIGHISPGGPKDITGAERQYFIDAKTSVENTIEESEDILEKLKQFEMYLNNPGNF